MIDETDISREKTEYNAQRANKVIENLQKRKMNGFYAANKKEALDLVLDMVPAGAVVARGDGISLDQIGLIEALHRRNQNSIIDPFQTDDEGRWPEANQRLQMMRETFFADILITGTNAVTTDGKLVNIDGSGNRVAAMIFGPSKVIMVAGVNKIVPDVESALVRIHQYSAPLNVKRHLLKHHSPGLADLPCAKTGFCGDCRADWRICNYTVIIDGAMPFHKGRINLVLVGEELGL
ncbi:MAG TPA: lactate utilization protein [Dehalococcoidales bacterium]|nr:lactate utilization protein [Dehalococcoidales bacterium]